MSRNTKQTDDTADEPLTNGELNVEETAEQQETAKQTIPNGDVTIKTDEKTPEKNSEFRIIRHLGGIQVATGSTATFSVLSSGAVDKVCCLGSSNLTNTVL